jgi:hypothetical protein
LAIRTASSSVSKRWRPATGPKVSSQLIAIRAVTPVSTVGVERDLLQPGSALGHQQLRDLVGAREAELAHERARGHLLPDRRRVLAVAGDDREHARRQPRLFGQHRNRAAESGVCSAGFSTIVQPAASAGAAFRVGMAEGKFQGVIPAVTPTGCFSTRMRRSGSGCGIVSP